jgi:hypothetical protein
MVSFPTPALKTMLSMRSRMFYSVMEVPLSLRSTRESYPMRKSVTLLKASF